MFKLITNSDSVHIRRIAMIKRSRDIVGSMMMTVVLFICLSTANQERALDFCMHESFNANCSSGRHVILMTSALYGRMEVGRCISEDLSVGCSANVLTYMDTWCTMRPSCNVSVRNFVDIHPCQRDFTSFLKAAFRCIRVQSIPPICPNTGVVEADSGSGHIFTEERLGWSTRCPWKIKGERGQQILLKVIFVHQSTGFLSPLKTSDDDEVPCSSSLFMIKDGEDEQFKQLAVCWRRRREILLHTSRSHVIFVYLQSAEDVAMKILIGYEAIGCGHVEVPGNAWMERKGSNAVVKCNGTQHTWYLTCQHNKWVGQLGNCSKALRSQKEQEKDEAHVTQGVMTAILVGILLGVLTGLFLLLIVLHSKRRGPSEMKSDEETKSRKRRQNNLQTRLLRNANVMKVSNLLMQEMTSHERFLLQDVDTNSESSPYNCKPRNEGLYKTYNNNNNNNNRIICCHEIPTHIGCDDDNFSPKHSDDYHRVVMHNLPLIQPSTDLSFNHSLELTQEPRSCLICMESSS